MWKYHLLLLKLPTADYSIVHSREGIFWEYSILGIKIKKIKHQPTR